MLSDEEKKELLEMARSERLREDFRKLRRNNSRNRRVDPATLWDFLTTMSRLAGEPVPPICSKTYPRMLM